MVDDDVVFKLHSLETLTLLILFVYYNIIC